MDNQRKNISRIIGACISSAAMFVIVGGLFNSEFGSAWWWNELGFITSTLAIASFFGLYFIFLVGESEREVFIANASLFCVAEASLAAALDPSYGAGNVHLTLMETYSMAVISILFVTILLGRLGVSRSVDFIATILPAILASLVVILSGFVLSELNLFAIRPMFFLLIILAAVSATYFVRDNVLLLDLEKRTFRYGASVVFVALTGFFFVSVYERAFVYGDGDNLVVVVSDTDVGSAITVPLKVSAYDRSPLQFEHVDNAKSVLEMLSSKRAAIGILPLSRVMQLHRKHPDIRIFGVLSNNDKADAEHAYVLVSTVDTITTYNEQFESILVSLDRQARRSILRGTCAKSTIANIFSAASNSTSSETTSLGEQEDSECIRLRPPTLIEQIGVLSREAPKGYYASERLRSISGSTEITAKDMEALSQLFITALVKLAESRRYENIN